jgi:hypothetical protein
MRAARPLRFLHSTLLLRLFLILLSTSACATSSSSSSSPSSIHGSPEYTYLSTPSPEPLPAAQRFRLPYPYPHQDQYNVRTNLRHEVWKSSPEPKPERVSVNGAAPGGGGGAAAGPSQREWDGASSSPPRKRPRLVSFDASLVPSISEQAAILPALRGSLPRSSPVSALSSRPQSPVALAVQRSSSSRRTSPAGSPSAHMAKKSKSKVNHILTKGIGKIKDCFGRRKGRCE